MRRLVGPLILAATVAACGEGPAAVPTRPAVAALVESTSIEAPLPPDGVALGETLQLQVFAAFADGTRQDVTRDAVWTVVDERVVRIAPGGLATAVGYGSTGIFASYRNVTTRIGISIRVVHSRSERVNLTVLVHDDAGAIEGARVTAVADTGELLFRVTDGNGFADFGGMPGFATFTAARLGYADATTVISGVIEPTRVSIRLVANPGSFVERRVSGEFDTFYPDTGESSRTYRIVTRAGGVFDAEVDSADCDYGGTLQLLARSGGTSFSSSRGPCYARLRFVVPQDELWLTVAAHHASTFRLTYREPR